MQVKHARSHGRVILVRCRSFSLTNGGVREVRKYTAATVDWIAVWDATTNRCFYVAATELGDGRAVLHLRLAPAGNNQRRGVRLAEDYAEF